MVQHFTTYFEMNYFIFLVNKYIYAGKKQE